MDAYCDVEIVVLVPEVRHVLAQVARNPAGAQVGARQPPLHGGFGAYDADPHGSVHENLVAGNQRVDLVESRKELVAKCVDVAEPALGNVAAHSADPRKRRRKPRARQLLKERVELFALRVAVHEHRPRTRVHAVGGDAYQVAGYAGELAAYHAQGLAARSCVYARELFGAEAIGDIVAEGGEIVEPVGERNELVVSHVLREFLLPAVEIADHRVAARDEIPVELELQT